MLSKSDPRRESGAVFVRKQMLLEERVSLEQTRTAKDEALRGETCTTH